MAPTRFLPAVLLGAGLSVACAAARAEVMITAPQNGPITAPPARADIDALSKGQQALRMRQFDQAERAFGEAYKLNPRSVEAMLGLAAAAQGTGKAKLARDWMSSAVAMAPGQANVLQAQGRLLVELGLLAEAEESYRAAIAGQPANVQLKLDLAALYLEKLKKPAQAAAVHSGALAINNPGATYSDHASFWSEGFRAILVIEDFDNDPNPQYHTPNDRVQFMDVPYFEQLAKLSFATTAHLAIPLDPGTGVASTVAAPTVALRIWPVTTDGPVSVQVNGAIDRDWRIELMDLTGRLVRRSTRVCYPPGVRWCRPICAEPPPATTSCGPRTRRARCLPRPWCWCAEHASLFHERLHDGLAASAEHKDNISLLHLFCKIRDKIESAMLLP